MGQRLALAGRTLGLVAVVISGLARAQAPAADTAPLVNPLRVGLIGPFTGPSADFGLPMHNGVRMAVDEINAAGGYLGRPLELVVKDDTARPDVGRKLAEELVTDKVVATIGFCNTGVAQQSLEVFQTARIPLIIPCATGTPLTSKYPAAQSYIFRTSARDAIQAPFIVQDLAKRGWTKVAVFADTTGYGEAGLKDVEAALAARQLKPVHVARFATGVKDLGAELKAAREAGANVIVGYTVGPENAVIAKGRRALKWDVPFVGPWTLSFPFFIDGARDAAEGALMVQTFIAEPSNERRAAFLANYARKYSATRITVPVAAAQGYDTAYLLMHALFGVRGGQPLDGPTIKAALENIQRNYYGVVATYEKPFSLDDKDAVTANMLYLGQVRNGAVTFAYPEDAKRNLFVQRKQ
ncbi:MAG: ABC transporter substrate-binding protein [Polaromonas sp.]|nr:ABC transporter substrate-binding protein [Polaromonas sp.]